MDGKVPVEFPVKETFVAGELMQQYFGMQEPVVHARPIRWWYWLTASNREMKEDSFAKENNFAHSITLWRSRLASALLFFFLLALLTLVLPLGIFTIDLPLIIVAGLLLFTALIAILCNRAGKPHSVGLLLAGSLTLSVCSVLLMSPGGLGADTLSLFGLLVFSELFLASLLPIKWTLFAAIFNSGIVISALIFLPETPDLAYAMQTSMYTLALRPVVLYFVVAGVLWLWVSSATRAIKRAEQAELVATHQYMLAVQEHVTAQQKHLLDASIEQIMNTLVQVANGDLKARVPLKEGALLWPLAIALNNLLSRIQRMQQIEQEFLRMLPRLQKGKLAEYELQRVREEVRLLKLIMQDARQASNCMHVLRNGTVLDPLIQELNGQYLSPLPPYVKSMRDGSTLPLPYTGNDNAPLFLPDSDGGTL